MSEGLGDVDEQGAAMSQEEVKSLWKDIAEIKAKLILMDENLRENFSRLPCSERGERIARAEQRLDNGSQATINNRAWIAVLISVIGMAVGWIFTILKLKG